jgi:hypothetical protein
MLDNFVLEDSDLAFVLDVEMRLDRWERLDGIGRLGDVVMCGLNHCYK